MTRPRCQRTCNKIQYYSEHIIKIIIKNKFKKSGETEHYVYANINQGKRNLTLNLNDQPLESHLKHLQNQKQLRVSSQKENHQKVIYMHDHCHHTCKPDEQ